MNFVGLYCIIKNCNARCKKQNLTSIKSFNSTTTGVVQDSEVISRCRGLRQKKLKTRHTFWNFKFCYSVHKSTQLDHILISINLVHVLPACYFDNYYCNIFPSKPGFSIFSLSQICPPKPCISLLSHNCHILPSQKVRVFSHKLEVQYP